MNQLIMIPIINNIDDANNNILLLGSRVSTKSDDHSSRIRKIVK